MLFLSEDRDIRQQLVIMDTSWFSISEEIYGRHFFETSRPQARFKQTGHVDKFQGRSHLAQTPATTICHP